MRTILTLLLLGVIVQFAFSQQTATNNNAIANSDSLFMQGKTDAHKYYKGYKGAGAGTLFASLYGGPTSGLVVAITCAITPPAIKNLNIPEANKKYPDYVRGYSTEAKKIKSKHIWTNYIIGSSALPVVIIVGLIVTTSSHGGGKKAI